MKKLFSILFAAMILLSGVHLSLATHLCGGEVAGVKWSVSEQNASCGMEMADAEQTIPLGFSATCCSDQISHYAVDNNYNPSILQINELVQQLLQGFYIPEKIGFLSVPHFISLNENVQPPGNYLPSAVSISDICVFLI